MKLFIDGGCQAARSFRVDSSIRPQVRAMQGVRDLARPQVVSRR
jgi:hypothetical protein